MDSQLDVEIRALKIYILVRLPGRKRAPFTNDESYIYFLKAQKSGIC